MSEQLIQTPGFFGDNGNFLLEREIGSGGMGGVYMGRDKMLDRPVAVKVMLKEYGSDEGFVEKFKKEAQAAARLIHPNIAQVYSYGICDGMPYIAMELVAGGSLYRLMQNAPGKTDVARVMKVCEQVAQALRCAADQGLVHGDIKPENILLDANGNAKIVDFGLAAMQKDTDEIWGTPYYISPEKVRKEALDYRSDMYSLGATLYHALTGVAPFEGEDPIAVVKKRFEGAPKKPSEIRPELTPAIDELVMKMLELEKDMRYPSFEALLEAFNSVLTSGLTQALPAGVRPGSAPAAKTEGGAKRTRIVRGRRIAMKKPGMRTGVKTSISPATAADDDISSKSDEDEDEDGGSVGGKIALVIFGIIAAIGLLVGGLVWYQIADKKAREREEQRQIVENIGKARQAITDNVAAAQKFADECDAMVAKIVKLAEDATKELTRHLPKELSDLLKPPVSDEVKAAGEALANFGKPPAEPPAAQGQAAQTTNAVPQGATNAAPAAAAAPAATPAAPAKPKLEKFRAPTEDESDPASPEHAEYQKQKKAFEEAQLKKLKEAAAAKAEPAKETPAPADAIAPAAQEKKLEIPIEVTAIQDVWGRTYSVMASALRVRLEIKKIEAKATEVEAVKEDTLENANKLGKLSGELLEMLEAVKGSKDVENIKKTFTFVKQKGEKAVKDGIKRIRIERLEKEREEKRKAAEEAEKKRLAEEAEAKKKLIEAETAEIKAKFDKIVADGIVRQLDWDSAERQLNFTAGGFKSAEGQLAVKDQLYKIEAMKKMQQVFVKSLKGYKFRRDHHKIKGYKVVGVDLKEIHCLKPDGKTKRDFTWQKFIELCPKNLNEILVTFIVKGRVNPKTKLNLRDWADSMIGSALILRCVLGDQPEAAANCEYIVKEVAKQYSDYKKKLEEIFPDIKLEATAEEE